MDKINTDTKREELESDMWSARELQSQLRKALKEIDIKDAEARGYQHEIDRLKKAEYKLEGNEQN